MKIKKLVWEDTGDEVIAEVIALDVSYYITEDLENEEGHQFVVEFPDGEEEFHATLAKAKAGAEKHWQEYAKAVIKEITVDSEGVKE